MFCRHLPSDRNCASIDFCRRIFCYHSAMSVSASRYQRTFNWLNAKRLMGVLMMFPKNITPEVSVEVAPDCMDVIGVILDVIVLD